MPAEDNTIQAKIEAVAEAIVLVEPTDLQALAELHTRFTEISRQATEDGQPTVVVRATAAAMEVIEKVILNDVADPPAALEIVTQTVCALQEILRDGRPADEGSFPPELWLAEPQSSGSPSALAEQEAEKAGAVPAETGSASRPLPVNVDAKLYSEFLTRQDSVLDEMERMILSLEKTEDMDGLQALQRLLHTLKGEAAIMGLDDVEKMCHATEDALGLSTPSDLVDGLLQVKDWLAQTFQACAGKCPMPASVEQALAVLPSEPAPRENTPSRCQSRMHPLRRVRPAANRMPVPRAVRRRRAMLSPVARLGRLTSACYRTSCVRRRSIWRRLTFIC